MTMHVDQEVEQQLNKMHVPGEPIHSLRAAVLQMLVSNAPWLALPAKRELELCASLAATGRSFALQS